VSGALPEPPAEDAPRGADTAPGPRRSRLIAVLTILASSAGALIAGTQPWFVFATDAGTVEASGESAAPGLAGLAIAGLALGAALTLAGPVFRHVFGALEVAIGLGLGAATIAALVAPYGSAGAAVTALTGVSGDDSIESLVTSLTVTPWPFVALAAALVATATGLWALATARRWPGPTRRYQAVRLAADEPRNAAGDWDALSGGDDPTDDDRPPAAR
jgi:hypothetical protein